MIPTESIHVSDTDYLQVIAHEADEDDESVKIDPEKGIDSDLKALEEQLAEFEEECEPWQPVSRRAPSSALSALGDAEKRVGDPVRPRASEKGRQA